MPIELKNISRDQFAEQNVRDGETWRFLDLSGEHLGVRVEELAPGGTSSFHHFHTLEEEHVIVLSGTARLHYGDEQIPLSEGDHMWFKAGEEIPHHIENTGGDLFRFLVFGERKTGDVVVYPNANIMMVKALEFGQYKYQKRKPKD